jgi:hypothetical protein
MRVPLYPANANLEVHLGNPGLDVEPLERARVSLEAAIAATESTWQLDPSLRNLLNKALDRNVVLNSPGHMENVQAPLFGSAVNLNVDVHEQTPEGKAVEEAANNAARILTEVPEYVLVRPISDSDGLPLTDLFNATDRPPP